MVDLSGTKSIYNWIVEPDSDNTTWNARRIKNEKETVTNYSSVATMISDINTDLTNGSGKSGGCVGIRNGTYNISICTSSAVAIAFGHSTTQTGATIILEGESRDGVVIKNLTNFNGGCDFINTICNLEVRNLTIDCNQ